MISQAPRHIVKLRADSATGDLKDAVWRYLEPLLDLLKRRCSLGEAVGVPRRRGDPRLAWLVTLPKRTFQRPSLLMLSSSMPLSAAYWTACFQKKYVLSIVPLTSLWSRVSC